MDFEQWKDIQEKYKSHWAVDLETGDRVTGTIRHQTDGSKNMHDVTLIVEKNLTREQMIIAWHNDQQYTVPYCELNNPNN